MILNLWEEKQYPPKVVAMNEAVISLLAEGRELNSLRVSEITARAGIGKGTAYEYFSSKAEIIATALEYDLAKQIARLKPDALVLLSNRIDDDGRYTLTEKINILLAELPEDIPLGIYEIPVPYKRLITDAELHFMANSGRFAFIKDTCCDVEIMRKRAEIVRGMDFGLFNANAATVLDTLRFGYAGFSGVMANIHPALYVWLYENQNNPLADRIIHYIAMTSVIEARCYPIIAKRYLREYEGLHITDVCRSAEDKNVPAVSYELRAVRELTREAYRIIGENQYF